MKIRTIDVKRLIQILNLYMLIFFMSCNTEGHWGVSENIAASKARKTYMYSYSFFTSSSSIDEYILPNIKEMFVEKSWFVGKPICSDDSEYLNLGMNIDNSSFSNEYLIGLSYENYFTYKGENLLVFPIDKSVLTDTLKFTLYKRGNGEKLSDVYMVKKN